MNILKLSNPNSTTLKNIENYDGKDCSLWFFFVCVKFHEKKSLNVVLLNLFVGTIKMLQGFANQNNILLNYYFICMCIDFTR
jgi:hypothetical protein